MNPHCPQCENELDEDFGIVNCKSCGTVCFVDLDGQVQVQGDEPPDETGDFVDSSEEPDFEPASEEDFTQDDDEPGSFEEATEEAYNEEAFEDIIEDGFQEGDGSNDFEPEELEESLDLSEEKGESEDLPSEETEEDFSLEVEAEDSVQEASQDSPLNGQDFLKGLEIFSQDLSPAEDFDHVFYDFVVSGLEDEDSWGEVIESLSDERLRVYEQDLLDQKELGADQVKIKSLPFVRLVVLYKRMAPLGYPLSWVVSENQEEAPAPFEEEPDEETFEEDFYGEDYSE